MLLDIQDMQGFLEMGLHHYKRSFDLLPLPEGLKPDDRWIVASALQKAIRRGQTAEAYRAALCLNQLHPDQLWSRLKTIAAEDVGIGDLQAVFDTMFVSGKKQWRLGHSGEDHVLAYIIEGLCSADKTRAADDLLYICDAHPDYATTREEYSGMNEQDLFDVIINKDYSIYHRMIAGWYLHGTAHHRPTGMVYKKGTPSHLLDVFRYLGMPESALGTFKATLPKTEGHGIGMAFSYMLLANSKTQSVREECIIPSQRIEHFNNESYDRHNLKGKAAFKKFLELCPDIANFIVEKLPRQNAVNVIGWCVFVNEGQALDRRLIFDGSEEIRSKVVEAWMKSRYMTPEIRTELLTMTKNSMDTLHEARNYVVGRK